jgi:hypothetical protein
VVEVSECDLVEDGASDESEDDRAGLTLFKGLGRSRRVGPAGDGDEATEAGERVIRSIVSRKEGKSWASRRGRPVM